MAENLVRDRLLDQRRALLDVGIGNRLINVPMRVGDVRTLEIVDEKSSEVYRLLTGGRGLTFLPGRIRPDADGGCSGEGEPEGWALPQPPERETGEGQASRHEAEGKLQTYLSSEGLQKRLFDIWSDARTFEEEQGANALFLALGVLRWFEDDTSDAARHAPLILLPVTLERAGADERFALRWQGEAASPNLSIQVKLGQEFGLTIEDFADEDAVDVTTYLAGVAAVVSGKVRWQVLPDAMVLGLFSLAKPLMHRDLDPRNWPDGAAPQDNALVAALLGQGFAWGEPVAGDEGPIDDVIPPSALNHVVDADAFQAVAIEEALQGRNLIIEGPPGTGKSQTITNIVAGAVLQGKKVLVMAQKKAALEVVQRRLRQVGLGPMTLELHSAGTTKRAVLDELRRTRDIPGRLAPEDVSLLEPMADTQSGLNHHAAMLHAALQPSGLSAYQVMGRLLEAREQGGLPGFELAGTQGWTAQEAGARLALAAEVAGRLEAVGDQAAHVWRGVGRDTLAPGDLDRLVSLLLGVEADIETLGQAADAAGRDFAVEIERLADFETLARAVEAAAALPPDADRSAMAGPVRRESLGAINDLIQLGRSYRRFSDAVALAYRPQAWRLDLRAIREEIATHDVSWTQLLNGPHRDAAEQLRSLLTIEMPADRTKQALLLDGMIAAQETRRRFEAQRHLGAEAFGTLWLAEDSDWDSLQAIADGWRDNPHATAPQGRESGAPAASLAQGVPRLFDDLGQMQQFLDLDLGLAFGVGHWSDLEVGQLTSRLRLWLDNRESLEQWVVFGERCRVAGEAGLGALVDGLRSGSIAPEQFMPTCSGACYEALRNDFLERLPDLKRFDGELQDLMVESFRVLDHGRIALARETVATSHLQARPAEGGDPGPLGVLNAELTRTHGHLPIRQLLDRAGPAVQQLKPVFLMSPLSVGHFLVPGGLTFDLVVIDEASQIEPLDAIGALARAGQVVVAGDERQLPPTSRLAGLLGDAAEEYAEDAESLLDLCRAGGMPSRILGWHHRSRHPSLIAISNRRFYDDRLMTAPSPLQDDAQLGLVLRHLPQARYDGGAGGTNPHEAQAVAEAVIAHARSHGEYHEAQSLGVVTVSVAQRRAILRELEALRRANPECEAFFDSDSVEPFFVKNLENVQGDERDVIFISVGYGRDEQGSLAMNFGPLEREGGEKRLNVLISRARYRCEVFSSIKAEDIEARRSGSEGIAALKAFLDFAENGRAGDVAAISPSDSPFEEAVAAGLRARGHDVVTAVGTIGFHVDLAVVDPERPGRYMLAIECDGAQYHAARSARDRDRLRQQVLEDLGWIVHRIWSIDWFERPEEEIAKVEVAIAEARLAWRQRDQGVASPSVVPEVEAPSTGGPEAMDALFPPGLSTFGETGAREQEPAKAESGEGTSGPIENVYDRAFRTGPGKPVELRASASRVTMSWPADLKPGAGPVEFGSVEKPALSRPYDEAVLQVSQRHESPDLSAARMAVYVGEVVRVEGPVHEHEIIARIRGAFGLHGADVRAREAVLDGIDVARVTGTISGGPFYTLPGQPIAVRDRSRTTSPGLRELEMLPPQEIEAALMAMIRSSQGVPREALLLGVSRALGFAVTSASLRKRLEEILDGMLARRELAQRDSLIVSTY